MKKLAILISLAILAFSCTKDEDGLVDDKSYDSEALYSMDGTGSSGGEGGENGEGDQDQIDPGQITAGEWNDLNNWDFWNNLKNEQDFASMDTYWKYNLNERISVLLKNSIGELLVNKKIELLDSDDNILWTSITDNFGKAELWPGLSNNRNLESSYKLKIENEIFTSVLEYSDGINELQIDANKFNIQNKTIDIGFMVDATGSMSDELEYLKVELIDVIENVESKNSGVKINMASVFYRDEGDEYLTRKTDFSDQASNTISFINKQSANGGGDFPEAVHTALNKSINDLSWSAQSYSRLLFILLDAPPHYDAQIVDEIHMLTKKAAASGIKLIPITASGIDKDTEFLMRYLSIASNGSYVFVTNHSGIGGDHIEPSIGQYEVEYLNELMVRLINKYLE